MASADSLVALFSAITQNLQQDREQINQLDQGDGDTGDNMTANFQLITDTLTKVLGQGNANSDVGAALQQAAQVLQQQGRGATAPIYAQGLNDAGDRLKGKQDFSIDDLMPLLEGLLSGSQRASGTPQGEGSLLDVLVPGILSYVQAKQQGGSEMEALLGALLKLRRTSNDTARSSRGYGRQRDRDTRGQLDSGAAGAASLLEGLFGALLQGAVQQSGSGTTRRSPGEPAPRDAEPSGGLGDLIGGVLRGLSR